jgi:hypothetical protein
MGTRVLTLSNLGFTGASNANYITNNNQLSNGAGYITSFTNTQRSDEEIRDIASAQWVNGTNTTVVKDDAGNTIKINSINTIYTHPTYTTSNINTSGATIVDSITTNSTGHITAMGTRVLTLSNLGFKGASNANYITNNNQLSNGAGYITSFTNTQLSTEQVQDIIGAMISGNSESNISVTYNDSTGKLDFSSSNTQLSDSDIANFGYIKSSGGGGVTPRSDEEIRDLASAQWINGTNTTVVKDDGANTLRINSSNTQLSNSQVTAITNPLYAKLTGGNTFSGDQTVGDIRIGGEMVSSNNSLYKIDLLDRSVLNHVAVSSTLYSYPSAPGTRGWVIKSSDISDPEVRTTFRFEGEVLKFYSGRLEQYVAELLSNGNTILKYNLTVDGSIFSSKYYDSSDSTYFIEPSDISVVKKIDVRGVVGRTINPGVSGWQIETGNTTAFPENKTTLRFDGEKFTFFSGRGTGEIIEILPSGATTYVSTLTAANLSGTNTGNETKASIDALGVNSSTLNSQNSAYYLNYNNFINTPNLNGYLTSGDISGKANLSGSNTFTGNQTVTANITATNFILSSDIRLKEDFLPLISKRLNPTRWTWIDSGEKDFGFIAQELEVDFPEVVVTDDKGFKKVAYNKITAINSAKINELEDENAQLKSEIKELNNKLDLIMKTLNL